MMKREYLNENVYEALQRRLKFLFEEFDNIFVSFSGGKDSGLLLNLVLDFQKAHYPDKRIGVFHQDFEAQYSATTEYVERTFTRIEKDVEPYWVCLPMATRTALSSYEMYWYPWDNTKEDAWVRPMPQHEYVINIKNNPMTTYRYRMHQEDLAKQFGRWYRIAHGDKKTVCLLGIRADESLQRYSGFLNRKYGYKEPAGSATSSKMSGWLRPYTTGAPAMSGTPIIRFNMIITVCTTFIIWQGLNPTKCVSLHPLTIMPKTASICIGSSIRRSGSSLSAVYGALISVLFMAERKPWVIKISHAGRAYLGIIYPLFTGNTAGKAQAELYKKFKTSIEFWHTVGGGLEEETIRELEEHGYNIRRNGVSNYTVMKNSRIVFIGKIPDHTDDIKSTKDIPSWKRMCFCILKNDHLCRFMGFGLTRQQQKLVDVLKKKYSKVCDEK